MKPIVTGLAGLLLVCIASCASDDVGGAGRLIDGTGGQRVYDQVTASPQRLTTWNAALTDPGKASDWLDKRFRSEGRPATPPPLLSETVERVKARIEPHMPGGAYPFPLVVEDCPAIHASVDATGAVLICRSVLASATSEDAIAFLVAHEMAHVLMGHARASQNTETLKTAGLLAGLLLDAMAENEENRDSRRAMKLGADALYTYPAKIGIWMQNAFEPDQEIASDLFAADLLERAGYNPLAGIDALTALSRTRPDGPTEPFKPDFVRFFETVHPDIRPPLRSHPEIQERMSRLQAYLNQPEFDEATDRDMVALPWTKAETIGSPRVIETVEFFSAYEAADIAINRTVEALRAMRENTPDGTQRAVAHCNEAARQISGALRSRAAADRDIRKRALAIGYFCAETEFGTNAILALDGTPQAGTWIYTDLLAMALLENNNALGRDIIGKMVARHGVMTTYRELLPITVRARSGLAGHLVNLCEDDFRKRNERENMSSDARTAYYENLKATCSKPRDDLDEAVRTASSGKDEDVLRRGVAYNTLTYLSEISALGGTSDLLNLGQERSKPWQQAWTRAFGDMPVSAAAANMAAGRSAEGRAAAVTVDLNLRDRPGPEGGNAILVVPVGAEVRVHEGAPRSPGWVRVTYQGKSGYVAARYLAYR